MKDTYQTVTNSKLKREPCSKQKNNRRSTYPWPECCGRVARSAGPQPRSAVSLPALPCHEARTWRRRSNRSYAAWMSTPNPREAASASSTVDRAGDLPTTQSPGGTGNGCNRHARPLPCTKTSSIRNQSWCTRQKTRLAPRLMTGLIAPRIHP